MGRKPAGILILILISMLIVAGCANSTNIQDENIEKNKLNSSNQQAAINNVESDDGETDITEKYWRLDNQSGLIAEVLWSTPAFYLEIGATELLTEYELEDYHVFDLVFHDHSGFLQNYSILDQVVLVVDEKEIKPVKEDVLNNDSHHPRVLLKFPLIDEQGKETIPIETNTVTLVLRDLADVPERTLTWQLPL